MLRQRQVNNLPNFLKKKFNVKPAEVLKHNIGFPEVIEKRSVRSKTFSLGGGKLRRGLVFLQPTIKKITVIQESLGKKLI